MNVKYYAIITKAVEDLYLMIPAQLFNSRTHIFALSLQHLFVFLSLRYKMHSHIDMKLQK
jgi:hypothetical protein